MILASNLLSSGHNTGSKHWLILSHNDDLHLGFYSFQTWFSQQPREMLSFPIFQKEKGAKSNQIGAVLQPTCERQKLAKALEILAAAQSSPKCVYLVFARDPSQVGPLGLLTGFLGDPPEQAQIFFFHSFANDPFQIWVTQILITEEFQAGPKAGRALPGAFRQWPDLV